MKIIRHTIICLMTTAILVSAAIGSKHLRESSADKDTTVCTTVISENTTEQTATTTEIFIEPSDDYMETSQSESLTTVSTTKKKTQAPTPETTVAVVRNSHGKSLGYFKITVYIPDETWGYQTALGVTSKHLKTCAVDPSVIPLGSTIYINGLELYCCDTGSAVKGNVIDIFYDGCNSDAINWISGFGTSHEVYLYE